MLSLPGTIGGQFRITGSDHKNKNHNSAFHIFFGLKQKLDNSLTANN
jgi:hypothetical protein